MSKPVFMDINGVYSFNFRIYYVSRSLQRSWSRTEGAHENNNG